jgi:hypothetical protein
MNFLKNRIFASLFTQRPSFLIITPQVGAFTIKVRKAQPDVFSKLTILNLGLRETFDARIKVNAIPTAPLKPP